VPLALVRAILPLLLGLTSAAAPGAPAPAAAPADPAPTAGEWSWPVIGPVIAAFDPPDTPFGAGHRGIDVAAAAGTTVIAPDAGVVAFAGRVAGELFVTIDHGDGLTSTFSWVSEVLVRKGDAVARGAPIARTGRGHPSSSVAHLHLGARRDGVYVDPLRLLGPMSVSDFIRLAPLAG
jgi:murein DD-endopeptidase MepM/ murein hydrolase activator NlpD